MSKITTHILLANKANRHNPSPTELLLPVGAKVLGVSTSPEGLDYLTLLHEAHAEKALHQVVQVPLGSQDRATNAAGQYIDTVWAAVAGRAEPELRFLVVSDQPNKPKTT